MTAPVHSIASHEIRELLRTVRQCELEARKAVSERDYRMASLFFTQRDLVKSTVGMMSLMEGMTLMFKALGVNYEDYGTRPKSNGNDCDRQSFGMPSPV